MTNQKAVAEKLLQIQAVKLSPDNPYTWASGWKSPIYCDNRRVLSFPYVRDFIKSELCNLVFEDFPDAALLAGVATAGIAWGAFAADQLIVVEDLVSTGKSSLQVVQVLRDAGVEVVGMVSIFSYGFDVADQAFKEAGIVLKSLTTYQEMIDLGKERGQITAEQEELLLNWRKNPSVWKQNV
jgi:orotate phosphoribosyltransferase